MIRRIDEGERISRGYGVAWYDVVYRRAVCAPIGLNKLLGLLHALWLWSLRPPLRPSERERLEGRLNEYQQALADSESRVVDLRQRNKNLKKYLRNALNEGNEAMYRFEMHAKRSRELEERNRSLRKAKNELSRRLHETEQEIVRLRAVPNRRKRKKP